MRPATRALAFFLASVCGAACDVGSPAPRPGPPNLLLITVDTLRADHLGSYGYRLDTSPNLDRLAERGVRFADATVQWPKTWPQLASMLTGKYPMSTGVRLYPRVPLPGDHETLAEVLKRAGYRTAAVMSNANAGLRFGFQQGFDHFLESWMPEFRRKTGKIAYENQPGLVKKFTNATVVTDQAIALIDGDLAKHEPFFLWLHYIDPHGPYVPPPAYADLFTGEHPVQKAPLAAIPGYQLQKDDSGQIVTDLGFYKAQYDREIRYFDDQLRRLLDHLDNRSLTDATLIVVTADHGESLDEDRYLLEHGAAPFQPTAGVPLLMVWKGRLPAETVVKAPVGLIDVLPTLLELIGVAPPPGMQGRSLVPLIQGTEEVTPQYVFMESGAREPTQLTVRQGKWKLAQLRARKDQKTFGRAEFELYDLESDPGEEKNLIEAHPEVAKDLKRAVRRWTHTTPEYSGTDRIEIEKLDERTREMLRALGYVE